jgi:hypothetical protein
MENKAGRDQHIRGTPSSQHLDAAPYPQNTWCNIPENFCYLSTFTSAYRLRHLRVLCINNGRAAWSSKTPPMRSKMSFWKCSEQLISFSITRWCTSLSSGLFAINVSLMCNTLNCARTARNGRLRGKPTANVCDSFTYCQLWALGRFVRSEYTFKRAHAYDTTENQNTSQFQLTIIMQFILYTGTQTTVVY